MSERDEVIKRMRYVVPNIRIAVEKAKLLVPGGTVQLAIVAKRPDGSGQLTASFDAAFLDDVETIVGDEP